MKKQNIIKITALSTILIMGIVYLLWSSINRIGGNSLADIRPVPGAEKEGKIYLDATIDSQNNIHLIWMAIRFDSAFNEMKYSNLYYQKGSQLGESWSNSQIIAGNGINFVNSLTCNPKIIAMGDSILVFWTSRGLVTKFSWDDGNHWNDETKVLEDVVAGRFKLLENSKILYIVYTNRKGTYFSISIDLGKTWKEPILIGPQFNTSERWSPVSMVINNASIYVVGELRQRRDEDTQEQPGLFFIRSQDLGASWETPKFIDLRYDSRINKSNSTRIVAPQILCTDKELLIFYNDSGLSYIKSDDYGASWSSVIEISKYRYIKRFEACTLNDKMEVAVWIDVRNTKNKKWAELPFLSNLLFDADVSLHNNDIYYSLISLDSNIEEIRITNNLSYAEWAIDGLFCGKTKHGFVLIWSGKENLDKSAISYETPSRIFYVVSDSEN
jgi:hypothetical protein